MQGLFSDGDVFFFVFPLPKRKKPKTVQTDILNRLFGHVKIDSLQLAASSTGFGCQRTTAMAFSSPSPGGDSPT